MVFYFIGFLYLIFYKGLVSLVNMSEKGLGEYDKFDSKVVTFDCSDIMLNGIDAIKNKLGDNFDCTELWSISHLNTRLLYRELLNNVRSKVSNTKNKLPHQFVNYFFFLLPLLTLIYVFI